MRPGTVIPTLEACLLLLAGSPVPCAADESATSMIVLRAALPQTEFTTTAENTDSLLSRCIQYFSEQVSFPGKTPEFVRGPEVSIPSTFQGGDISSYVIEACRLADKDVDFSDFDLDGDGFIDNVCVYFSGSSIDPQQYSLEEAGKTAVFDRKALNGYIALSEYYNGDLTDYSILSHEYCHSLGLQDLYDTDAQASSGISEALWKVLSPMDFQSGSLPEFSAVDYDCLGVPPSDTLRKGRYTLTPEEDGFYFYPGDVKGEYFLFERREIENDSTKCYGLAVYHIDKSHNRSGFSTRYQITLTALQRWERNQINCRPDHQCADLVEADQDASDPSTILFPAGTSQTFCSDSEPAFRYWSGNSAPIALYDVRRNGDGSVSFDVIEPIGAILVDAFQNEATISFLIDDVLLPTLEECRLHLEDSLSLLLAPSPAGQASVTLTGLEPNHSYAFGIDVVSNGQHYSRPVEFTTMVIDERNPYPFIYLAGTQRNADGSFKSGTQLPLRVFNAVDAESIRWYFNSVEVSSALKLSSDGELRAEIRYADGTSDIITKHIFVR